MQKTLLKIENLHASVEEKEILKGLHLEIKEEEIVAGKSNLANVIMGHPGYSVTDGHFFSRMMILLKQKPTNGRKKGMFLSFQAPEEIPGITMENFLKSARAALTGEEVKAFPFHKEVLAKCKSFKWIKAMPSVM